MARKRRQITTPDPPWSFVAFTDLHVRADTIDRCVQALRAVYAIALDGGHRVVCLGDFWDQRGVLSVRQLDRIHAVFDAFYRAGIEVIMIPGNHDQVTLDGTVHGVQWLGAFPNVIVATEPYTWPHRKVAFLPWREDPAKQAKLFDDLPGDGWTVFAHAEAEGARTNYGHEAIGRVRLRAIEKKTRACYLGHYHRRQKLGTHTWYLGNPYQKDFGERDDPPKGISIIRNTAIEPEWVPLPLPRHHVLALGELFDVGTMKPDDRVRVYVPPEKFGTDEAEAYRATIPTDHVQMLARADKVPEGADDGPAFALSLDQAIDVYLETADVPDGLDVDALAEQARLVLKEIPEAAAVVPMFPEIDVLNVEIDDFCGLRGHVSFELDDGLVLVRGPVGSGKTAMVDAITWALYGQTSPRRPGSSAAATFRGDEVIHDGADRTMVAVHLRAPAEGREFVIVREKARGKGARASVRGLHEEEGIADTQDVINRIVGLDYTLWRSCVSLGQGSVGTFVTEAQKARTELLSNAFGLGACVPAQKLVRSRLKAPQQQLDQAERDLAAEQHALDTLRGQDYAAEIRAWDERRDAAIAEATATAERAAAVVADLDAKLETEPQWITAKAQHEQAVNRFLDRLATLSQPSEALAKAERDLGAARAELGQFQADLARAQADLARVSQPGAACPTCARPLEGHAPTVVEAAEVRVRGLQDSIRSQEQRIVNLENAKRNAVSHEDVHRERAQVQDELVKSREALAKVGQGLEAFGQIRRNRDEHASIGKRAQAEIETQRGLANPWRARQEQLEEKFAEIEQRIAEAREETELLRESIASLKFWADGFGPNGLPLLVLVMAIHELEAHANRFLGPMLGGELYTQLAIVGEDLVVRFFEVVDGKPRERRYEQLSGGQRRCVELAFSPFALSEMIFERAGTRVPLLVIDELTTHLGAEEKPIVVETLRQLDRRTVVVIDHDAAVQGEFDLVYEVARTPDGRSLLRLAA